MGNDCAERGEDPGTYEIVRLREDHIIHIENEKSYDQPTPTTVQQIIGLDEKFYGDMIFIDDEGQIGRVILSQLLDDDRTKWNTKGISNSKRIYDSTGKERGIKIEELHVQLLSLMEKGKIDLLADESVFKSFTYVK